MDHGARLRARRQWIMDYGNWPPRAQLRAIIHNPIIPARGHPVILLPSHHGSKATLCGKNVTVRASRAPLVTTVDLVGAVATPETRRPGPEGPPGPGGGSRGLIPAQPESAGAGLRVNLSPPKKGSSAL